jgi:hypothetical protein
MGPRSLGMLVFRLAHRPTQFCIHAFFFRI